MNESIHKCPMGKAVWSTNGLNEWLFACMLTIRTNNSWFLSLSLSLFSTSLNWLLPHWTSDLIYCWHIIQAVLKKCVRDKPNLLRCTLYIACTIHPLKSILRTFFLYILLDQLGSLESIYLNQIIIIWTCITNNLNNKFINNLEL